MKFQIMDASNFKRPFRPSSIQSLLGASYDQKTKSGSPTTLDSGTKPQKRLSQELSRLSPMTNKNPGGTCKPSLLMELGISRAHEGSSPQAAGRVSISLRAGGKLSRRGMIPGN